MGGANGMNGWILERRRAPHSVREVIFSPELEMGRVSVVCMNSDLHVVLPRLDMAECCTRFAYGYRHLSPTFLYHYSSNVVNVMDVLQSWHQVVRRLRRPGRDALVN